MRTGVFDLPLHYGKAPYWLFKRMIKLSEAISNYIIEEYGPEKFLERLSDPLWFQALGCVIGFDWHSSGLTSTTCAALKYANLKQVKVCGGKGLAGLKTPQEIKENPFDLSEDKINSLIYASKMAAKSDNVCLQDSYQLYQHTFIFTENSWVVIQQGMNNSYARRYHWYSKLSKGFVEDTNTNIIGFQQSNVLDLTSSKNKRIRELSVELINYNSKKIPKYKLPKHHNIRFSRRDIKFFETVNKVDSYEELVSLKGMGLKKIRALALISELIYGEKIHWADPVKYSFAHGGKDGHPYPVDKKTYDHSIKYIQEALIESKLDNKTKQSALKKLVKLNIF